MILESHALQSDHDNVFSVKESFPYKRINLSSNLQKTTDFCQLRYQISEKVSNQQLKMGFSFGKFLIILFLQFN